MPKSDAALRKRTHRVGASWPQRVKHCCDATTGTAAIECDLTANSTHFLSFDVRSTAVNPLFSRPRPITLVRKVGSGKGSKRMLAR